MDPDREDPQAAPLLEDFSTAIFYGAAEGLLLARIEDARCVEVNAAFCRITGRSRDELVGRTGDEAGLWVDPGERAQIDARLAAGEDPMQILLHLRRGDGAVRVVDWDIRTVEANGERVLLFTVRDVTERTDAKAAFRETEQLYRMVVDSATDLVAIIDPTGTVVYASPSHTTVLGFAPEEIVGASVFAFQRPDTQRASRESFARAAGGERTPPVAYRLLHKDGHLVELEGVGWQPLFDESGDVHHILTISRDVSERRRAEEDRSRLLARVVEAQEEERHRIAGDVHDDPLQALTALGLRLQLLRRHVQGEGAELLTKLQATADRAQTSLRTLVFELRPPSLDREGLAAAIREDLRAVGDGLQTEVVNQMAGDPSPGERIVLYRIAREALRNVRTRGSATRIEVHLREADGGTLLRVEDDGTDLAVDDPEGRPRVGLSTMHERAALAGGWLRISSRPEGGTVVECWIPAFHGDG